MRFRSLWMLLAATSASPALAQSETLQVEARASDSVVAEPAVAFEPAAAPIQVVQRGEGRSGREARGGGGQRQPRSVAGDIYRSRQQATGGREGFGRGGGRDAATRPDGPRGSWGGPRRDPSATPGANVVPRGDWRRGGGRGIATPNVERGRRAGGADGERGGWGRQGERSGWDRNGNRDLDRGEQGGERNWNRGDRGDWNRGNPGNWDNRRDRDGRQGWNDGRGWNNRGLDSRRNWNDRGWNDQGWNRGWRNDRRYNWQGWRNNNRHLFRGARYIAPRGWGYGYQRFGIGISLFPGLYSQSYWLNDPWAYRLPPAYAGYRWVRYYDDVLLVDLRSGHVVDVIYDFFW